VMPVAPPPGPDDHEEQEAEESRYDCRSSRVTHVRSLVVLCDAPFRVSGFACLASPPLLLLRSKVVTGPRILALARLQLLKLRLSFNNAVVNTMRVFVLSVSVTNS
jgi:hypothetical protein